MTFPDTAHRLGRSWLLKEFIFWYFIAHPLAVIRTYARYAQAFGDLFSFIFLLKSFFAPWKSIAEGYQKKGFNIGELLQTLTLNVTSRVIGMIFRLAAMILGIVLEVMLALGFALYLIAWIAFPFVVLAALGYIPFSLT